MSFSLLTIIIFVLAVIRFFDFLNQVFAVSFIADPLYLSSVLSDKTSFKQHYNDDDDYYYYHYYYHYAIGLVNLNGGGGLDRGLWSLQR